MYDIDYIVVPLDLSRSSRAALAMARSMGVEEPVDTIHVVAPWPKFMDRVLFPYAPLGEDAPVLEQSLVDAAEAALLDYHEIGDDDRAPNVRYGPCKDTLLNYIKQTPAQLVVAGAFGEGGPMPDALGSTAERLVLSAGRPVLLVRDLDVRPTVKKVLVALDLTENSQPVLEVAARLAVSLDATLEILHVVPDPLADDQTQVLGTVLKFDRKQAGSRSRDRIEAMFDRMLKEIEPGFGDVAQIQELFRRRRVVIGAPAATILGHAHKMEADVVVVGSQNPARPAGHLGHVALTVLRRCPTHVCVVPLAKQTQMADEE